jgi:DNA polymerase I-like protein with 3'-5' exonuclease and polymerase domains
MVYNAFGFRRFYNDRVTEYLLPQALAWICQSTVAIVTNKVLLYCYNRFCKRNPDIRILLQIHDSLLFQIRTEELSTYIPLISMAFDSVVVPYDDPLVIPHELKYSNLNWGSMHDYDQTSEGLPH